MTEPTVSVPVSMVQEIRACLEALATIDGTGKRRAASDLLTRLSGLDQARSGEDRMEPTRGEDYNLPWHRRGLTPGDPDLMVTLEPEPPPSKWTRWGRWLDYATGRTR